MTDEQTQPEAEPATRPFRGEATSRSNLDMLLDLDEPELFMREVVARAANQLTSRPVYWGAIVDGGRKILDKLEALNAVR